MATAPNVKNYTIPRGTAVFTPTAGSPITLGNITQFRYSADVTKLDHFSSQAGIRTKDRSVVTQLGATIAMIVDEINEDNMALFLLADTGTSSLGGLTNTNFEGTLVFTGTNDIGSQVNLTAKVQLQPGGEINLITENDWMNIPLNAEVLLDAGAYGVWTIDDEPTA